MSNQTSGHDELSSADFDSVDFTFSDMFARTYVRNVVEALKPTVLIPATPVGQPDLDQTEFAAKKVDPMANIGPPNPNLPIGIIGAGACGLYAGKSCFHV